MNRKFAAISVSCLATFSLAAGFFALSRARARTERPRAQAPASVVNAARVRAGYGQLPLSFEVNAGQTDARVKFLARARAYTLFLTDRDATLRLLQPSAATGTPSPWARATGKGSAKVSGAVVRFSLAGSASPSAMEALEPQPGHSNYFVGNDPARWHRDIPHYARVKYREVYPGVDVVYYGNQGQLESDYIVAPGADPRQIALKIEGADALTLNPRDGVTLSTKAGDLLLQQPVAYQQNGAQRVEVAANYVRRGAHLFGIHVGPYDTQRPLIIDPNVVNPALGYSTYLGGTADNLPFGIAADSTGFAYVTGFTAASDFPTIAGSFQTALKNVSGSAFVTKLKQDGTGLIYSTYLGGTGAFGESAHGIGVDAAGDAYVVGSTSSMDFPVTPSAFQSANLGGGGFFTKLNSTGTALLYSTYLSGSGKDFPNAVAVDSNGNAYIAGNTTSSNFPLTLGSAIQTSNNATGPIGTAFLSRIDPTLSGNGSLIYSTYLGGSTQEAALGVAVDAGANAYITGETSSLDFPMTSINTGFQTTLKNNNGGAFIARIDTTQANRLVYSTFASGTANGSNTTGDSGTGIALGPTGDAYMVGASAATDYPTFGAFDVKGNAPNAKVVITRVNTTKSGAGSLIYSTYFGGSRVSGFSTSTGVDIGFGIAIDPQGNIYVAGSTTSIDFPVSASSPQPSRTGGTNAFVSQLNPEGSAVLFSSYLGGQVDVAQAVALDGIVPPSAYITGTTMGSFPTTTGAFQIVDNAVAAHDGFVAKISPAGFAGVFATPLNVPFGTQTVNTSSAARRVAVVNNRSTALTINSIATGGASPNDFAVSATTCPISSPTLGAFASCTISLVFTPSTPTAETATLVITDNDVSSPRTISLSGTGIGAPNADLTPSSLTFGPINVGSTTAIQAATLTNNSPTLVTINSITVTGANAADFKQTSTNCGATLAIAASCLINLTFTPSIAGSESATLSVADSDPTSPQTAKLIGTGLSTAPDFAVAVSPSSNSLIAGATAAFTVTVSAFNGFSSPTSLVCSGAPPDSTCTLNPATVTPSGATPGTSNGTVKTAVRTLAPPLPSVPFRPNLPVAVLGTISALLAMFAAWLLATRRGSRKLAWSLAALAALGLTSCSGLPRAGTPKGAFTITVTATSGALTHSSTTTLNVN